MSMQLHSADVNTVQSIRFDMDCTSYGTLNPLTHGTISAQNPRSHHPLESSLSNFQQNKLQREMIMMRNVQGLHAPMRLAMELKAVNHIGRHPFLPSSFLMKDVLLARDEEIGFEDTLNTVEFNEQMRQPHAVVEKQMGLL